MNSGSNAKAFGHVHQQLDRHVPTLSLAVGVTQPEHVAEALRADLEEVLRQAVTREDLAREMDRLDDLRAGLASTEEQLKELKEAMAVEDETEGKEGSGRVIYGLMAGGGAEVEVGDGAVCEHSGGAAAVAAAAATVDPPAEVQHSFKGLVSLPSLGTLKSWSKQLKLAQKRQQSGALAADVSGKRGKPRILDEVVAEWVRRRMETLDAQGKSPTRPEARQLVADIARLRHVEVHGNDRTFQ